MSISFKGNTPDFKLWVFDIDGKTFIARNGSSQSPLRITFTDGRFYGTATIDQIVPGAVLVKNTGFDIVTGTSQVLENKTGAIVMTGIVEWTWGGKKYRNRWNLTEGMELSAADPEEGVPATFAFDLDIAPPYTPYDGPAGGPVGPATTPPPSIPQQVNEAVTVTQDSLSAANKALAISETQRKVDLQALNTARAEIESAKKSLADAQAKATQEQQVLLAQMREQLQVMQERADVQVNIYRQMLAQQQAPQTPPSRTPPVVTSPVVTPPTSTPPATTTEAAPDWVKLGLQLGAAYLLLS